MSQPQVDPPLYVTRPAAEDDLPFIFNSFLKSYRDSPTVRSIPNSIYYAFQHPIIERLLKVADVTVACNPDDPNQIFGYCIAQPMETDLVFHWVYIKHPFRSFGIAKGLESLALDRYKPKRVLYTHRVKSTDRLMEKRDYVYHPYLLG